jgi:hypothetical protein
VGIKYEKLPDFVNRLYETVTRLASKKLQTGFFLRVLEAMQDRDCFISFIFEERKVIFPKFAHPTGEIDMQPK